jgi:4-hydroxy-3-polyprenylbenzoate decarboxylase
MKKIVIAGSGASGAGLAQKVLTHLPSSIEVHYIQTKHTQTVMQKEQNITLHVNEDIAASIASGSFGVDAMMITPCSMNTLAKIACGIADNLVTRAASVMIKEQKKLLLAPRELPFSVIALENMHKLSSIGVIIAPPVLGYYSKQQSLDEMEDFIIGKWFDLLGIENNLYKRWEG